MVGAAACARIAAKKVLFMCTTGGAAEGRWLCLLKWCCEMRCLLFDVAGGVPSGKFVLQG